MDKKELKKEIFSWVRIIAIALVVAIVLRSKVIILANIPSESMCNTIKVDDQVFGNRLAYEFGEPERGDVAIFYAPDEPDTLFIKRVIGLPGEKVVIKDAKIYINDSETPLKETYIAEKWTSGSGEFEFNVPENSYLMLGDNRNRSKDAREWEHTYVSRDAIVAKAQCIYFPFSHMKSIDGYDY